MTGPNTKLLLRSLKTKLPLNNSHSPVQMRNISTTANYRSLRHRIACSYTKRGAPLVGKLKILPSDYGAKRHPPSSRGHPKIAHGELKTNTSGWCVRGGG